MTLCHASLTVFLRVLAAHFDAAAAIVSALMLHALRTPESAPPVTRGTLNMRQEIAAGLRTLLSRPMLWIIIVSSMASELFYAAARRVGVGSAIIGGWLIESVELLLIPLASGSATVLILIVAQAVISGAGAITNIHQWAVRQAVTPDTMHGRFTASHRFLVYGASAVDALLGGTLGRW